MNTPAGVSLFQGADPLKLNSTLERQEEEEAIQDENRRKAELGDILENAFDDLNDDDDDEESTVDSTSNFPSDLLPSQPLPLLPTLSAPQQQQQQQQPQQQQQQQEQQQHQIVQQPQVEHVTPTKMLNLKMLLESKTHEINNIYGLATEARNKVEEFQKRLTITEAKLERALREKQNTHELLVESKAMCSNLDNEIEKLRSEKRSVEAENTQLVGRLETVQTLLDDLRRQYDMVKRDQHKWGDYDMRIKQLEEHYRAEKDLLQQQVNQLSEQLDKKKQELDQMHVRYESLQSSHDLMVMDKAEKINELSSALDIAQRQYRQLSAKPTYEAEYELQKQTIADLNAQVASMKLTIAQLTERLNGTTTELDMMDTLIQQHHSESESPSRLPSRLMGSTPLNLIDRIGLIKQELYRALATLKTKREEVCKLEKKLEDRTKELQTLRDEENKTLVQMANLKEDKLRLETRVKGLQEQLTEQQQNSSDSVHHLQTEYEAVLAEKDTLHQQMLQQTAERQKVEKELKEAQLELEKLKLDHEQLRAKHDQLMEDNRQLRTRATADNERLELERHKILLKDAEGEVERLKNLYTDIANEKETLSYQLHKLSETDTIKELEEQRQQIASLHRNVELAELKSKELQKILDTSKLSHERDLQKLREKWEREQLEKARKEANECPTNCKCNDQIEEITKMEIQILKLQNMNSMQAKELIDLRSELELAKEMRAELEKKLEGMLEQEKQLKELKAKAQLYEEQLKQKAEKGSTDLPSPNKQTSSPSSMSRCDVSPSSPQLTHDRIKNIEQRVRDEMAKLFASELKRFTLHVQQVEERSLSLQREYQVLSRDLQHRETEVDLLKQTILAEREEVKEILNQQEEKQKQLLQKCRSELQAKNKQITDLIRDLDEQHANIESERRSMKTVMAEWNKQKQSIEQVEQHWRDQVQKLRDSHEEAMRTAHQRYQSAKRTAQNYKLYAEDKEAHMKREYERIKLEYQTSLSQIEATMQQHLQRKNWDQQRHKRRLNDKENEPSNR